MQHFISLKNYISRIFKYCSNYICMNNAFCKFFFYLHLDSQMVAIHPQYQITEFSLLLYQKVKCQDVWHTFYLNHNCSIFKTLPLPLCPQQTCSVNRTARHTVRFVCVLKTAPQFTAIRHCVQAGAPGALCVCSYPAVKLLSTLFPSFQRRQGLVSSRTLSTIHPSPTKRNTMLHSQLHIYYLQLSNAHRENRCCFLYIVRFLSIPRCLLFLFSLTLGWWTWLHKTRSPGANCFFTACFSLQANQTEVSCEYEI